jgi:cytochrome c2
MKATWIVYAAFAVAAPVMLVLAACGAATPEPGTPEASYIDLGCAKCHGPAREGRRSGPPLVKIEDHWDEEGLMQYLRDPKTFVEANPRLSYMGEKYPIMMPAFAHTDEEQLRQLAVFILEG